MDADHMGFSNDGRSLVGQMLAYDKHMNFVLAECEEFRTVKVLFTAQHRHFTFSDFFLGKEG